MLCGSERERSEVIIFFCLFSCSLIGLNSSARPFCRFVTERKSNFWLDESTENTWEAAREIFLPFVRLLQNIKCDYSSIDTLCAIQIGGVERPKALVKSRAHSSSATSEIYRSETSIKNRQLIFLNLSSSDLSLDFSSFLVSRNDFFTHFERFCSYWRWGQEGKREENREII